MYSRTRRNVLGLLNLEHPFSLDTSGAVRGDSGLFDGGGFLGEFVFVDRLVGL